MNHVSLFESPVKRGAGLIAPALPADYRLLLSGHFAEYIHDLHGLTPGHRYAELQALGHINERALASDASGDDFSMSIRQGVPGVPGEGRAHVYWQEHAVPLGDGDSPMPTRKLSQLREVELVVDVLNRSPADLHADGKRVSVSIDPTALREVA